MVTSRRDAKKAAAAAAAPSDEPATKKARPGPNATELSPTATPSPSAGNTDSQETLGSPIAISSQSGSLDNTMPAASISPATAGQVESQRSDEDFDSDEDMEDEETQEYLTHHRKIQSWSRIDHVLISLRLKSKLRDAFVRFDAPVSDHRPVGAQLDIPHTTTTPNALPSTNSSFTRLHPSLFADPLFAANFETWSRNTLLAELHALPPDYRWEVFKRRTAVFAASFAANRHRTRENRRRYLEAELATLENSDDSRITLSTRWTALQEELQTLTNEQTRTTFLRTATPLYPDSSFVAHSLHQKLAARKASTSFPQLHLENGTHTADIEIALAHAHRHFAAQFTPNERDPVAVAAARTIFLEPIRTSTHTSDPNFGRRWDPERAKLLSQPISSEEVLEAINSAPSSSSPGLVGLPYEFYKQNRTLLAETLADAFNAAWERGQLQPSMTEARVRLLFKASKSGADPTLLSHYRPISLRETDYRLLARILVKRVNPLLKDSIPANQVGFVPGRSSADAGLHLQLLVEELKASGLPEAALISLDQEKAYDLVDHEWILQAYEAFGAPAKFLALLSLIYDSSRLTARYNLNGFLTDPVPLRCGLPQGCPLSCASWLVSFQPFLDSLRRRDIALSLPRSLSTRQLDILTYLAFADDSILAVLSLSYAIPLLEILAQDWRVATNGRLNTGKTIAFAIGPAARDDPLGSAIVSTPPEEYIKWAGFPISLEPQPLAFYSLLLAKIRKRCERATRQYGTARTRALYANSHILALSLHSLAFYPAPVPFLRQLRTALLDFVSGSKHHPVRMDVVFLPVRKGGLGLIDPLDVDRANNIRRLDTLLSVPSTFTHSLLLASFDRHVAARSSSSDLLPRSPWALFRKRPLRVSHPLWSALATVASSLPLDDLHFHLDSLSTSNILALPPSLFVSHPSLDGLPAIADLYCRSQRLLTLPPSYGLLAKDAKGIKNARIVWNSFVVSHPVLSLHFPNPVQPLRLPSPTPPSHPTFRLLNFAPGLSSSEARSRIVNCRPPSRLDPRLEQLFSAPPSGDALARRTWSWIFTPPATPRKADTHWRLLHNGIMTRSRLAHFAQGATSSCVFCSDASDDVVHALFTCGYSKEYWQNLLSYLSGSLSSAFTTSTFSADEVLLGLPTLRLLTDDRNSLDLRAIVAVAIQKLVDTRWARIRSDPLLSSPSPSDLALSTVYSYIHRLS
ncbi:hypothetical protein JCM16303_007389 [Sporobolomyces ruberrimus]